MGRLISGIPFCDCDSYPCDYVALDVMLQFFGYTTATVLHDEWYFSYQLEGSAEVKISPRITHCHEGSNSSQLTQRRRARRWSSLKALSRPRGDPSSRTRFYKKWIKVICLGRQTDYCLIFPLVYIFCKFNMICIGGGPSAWQGALNSFEKVVTAAFYDRQMRISRSWLPT